MHCAWHFMRGQKKHGKVTLFTTSLWSVTYFSFLLQNSCSEVIEIIVSTYAINTHYLICAHHPTSIKFADPEYFGFQIMPCCCYITEKKGSFC